MMLTGLCIGGPQDGATASSDQNPRPVPVQEPRGSFSYGAYDAPVAVATKFYEFLPIAVRDKEGRRLDSPQGLWLFDGMRPEDAMRALCDAYRKLKEPAK